MSENLEKQVLLTNKFRKTSSTHKHYLLFPQEAFWRIPSNLSVLDLRNIVAGLALDENNTPIAADKIKIRAAPKQKKKEKKKKRKEERPVPKKKNANKFAALRDLVKKKADAKKTKRCAIMKRKFKIS